MNKGEFGNTKQIVINENPLEMLGVKSTESVDGAKSQLDQSFQRRVKLRTCVPLAQQSHSRLLRISFPQMHLTVSVPEALVKRSDAKATFRPAESESPGESPKNLHVNK